MTPNSAVFGKKKQSETRLLPSQDLYYSAMGEEEGYLDCPLLTLSLPLRAARPGSWQWFQRSWERQCVRYGQTYKEKIQFRATATRGPAGIANWSCHIVFKEEPTHLQELVSWWNESYGKDRAKLSSHDNGLRYWVKNVFEPNSETWDGRHNRKRRQPLPKTGATLNPKTPEPEDPWALGEDDL